MRFSFAFMRWVDGFVGRPLARLFAPLRRPDFALCGEPPSAGPERAIVAKFLGLGSAVFALPLLKALKDRGAKVAFWGFLDTAEVVRLSGLADEIWIIEPDAKNFLASCWRGLRQARSFRADAFFDLEPAANFSSLLASLSRAGLRVGFLGGTPSRERHFTHLRAYRANEPAWKQNLELIVLAGGKLPASVSIPRPRLTLRPADYLTAAPGRRRVVINIRASDLSRHRLWPMASWRRLGRDLALKFKNVDFLLPGSKHETRQVDTLAVSLRAAVPKGTLVHDVAGRTSLEELLAVLATADLVLTVESGIMHLAAWVGRPVVALFGPETPQSSALLGANAKVLYLGLPCSPCLTSTNTRTRCTDNQCMKRISTDMVLQACADQLDQNRTAA